MESERKSAPMSRAPESWLESSLNLPKGRLVRMSKGADARDVVVVVVEDDGSLMMCCILDISVFPPKLTDSFLSPHGGDCCRG